MRCRASGGYPAGGSRSETNPHGFLEEAGPWLDVALGGERQDPLEGVSQRLGRAGDVAARPHRGDRLVEARAFVQDLPHAATDYLPRRRPDLIPVWSLDSDRPSSGVGERDELVGGCPGWVGPRPRLLGEHPQAKGSVPGKCPEPAGD